MPLTDAECRKPNNTGKPEKRFDGGGLYLRVTPTGKKTWQIRYRFNRQDTTMPLGSYPAVTLAQARMKRESIKVDIQAGRDPQTREAPRAPCPTLREAAGAFIDAQRWAAKYRALQISRMQSDIFPSVGDKRLDEIFAPELLVVLRKVEDRGALEMARRLGSLVGRIYKRAIVEGHVTHNPADGISTALKASRRVQHRRRLPASEMGRFLVKLKSHKGDRMTAIALEVLIRTALRTSEVRFGKWQEVESDLWRIPGKRMKVAGPDHLVPLTPQVKILFAEARELGKGSSLMFLSEHGAPMSQNTMLHALYRLGYHSKATVHGFRGTFSSWANEQGKWHPDAIERQLAHMERNEIRAAYNAAEHLPARRDLMEKWNHWLDHEWCVQEALDKTV